MRRQIRVRFWFEQLSGNLSPTDRQRAEGDLEIYRRRAEQAASKGDEESFSRYCVQIEALQRKLEG